MATDHPLEQRVPAPRADNQDDALFGQTPSQTVGPFFHYGLPWRGGADLVGQSDMGARADLFDERHYVLNLAAPTGTPDGEVVEIEGRLRDADGSFIRDAMIEIWQANAAGRYASSADPREEIPIDPHFVGFGRAAIDGDGLFRFRTIRPGCVPGPGRSMQAAHIAVSVFGRGMLKRLATRIYFAGDAALDTDPVLRVVPAERRHTLIAQPISLSGWQFDIALAGADETVFFDL